MLWINFLHLYQPAMADNETVIEATEKSYSRIIKALKKNPDIRFTLNITGCLLDSWSCLGYGGLIEDIGQLLKRGQIELTGSAAYHSFLPLLPEAEAKRQIELNDLILKKYFGRLWRPRGFFLPEAAYSRKTARLVKQLGYDWIMLDEISARGRLGSVDFTRRYADHYSGLKACFRSRQYSKSYVPHTVADLLGVDWAEPVVTATDAELYGLRHADVRGRFEKLLKDKKLKTETVSRYLDSLTEETLLSPVASSWESTEKYLAGGNPYHLWNDKRNRIQTMIWELANLSIATVNKYPNDDNWQWARGHLDKGLSSCTFWWASAQDFRLFSSISWSPDEIERGVNELIRAIRALDDVTTRSTKICAEKLYIAIKRLVWQKHWRFYWKKSC